MAWESVLHGLAEITDPLDVAVAYPWTKITALSTSCNGLSCHESPILLCGAFGLAPPESGSRGGNFASQAKLTELYELRPCRLAGRRLAG